MKSYILPGLCALSILVGCNSMKITTEQAVNSDMTTIKTYQWIPGPIEILDEIDTYINDHISPEAWIQERLAPLLPMSAITGPSGLYYAIWDYDASESDVILRISTARGAERQSAIMQAITPVLSKKWRPPRISSRPRLESTISLLVTSALAT